MNGSVLPESLDSIQKSDYFPSQRHRWNTNEEIAAILIAIDKHEEWLSKEVKIRPKSGSMMLYSRKRVRYRRDGYCWKKRKDGKTTREDHMKLKVQGTECIYGCYVHSAILPTFHRRCYWLLQNPDIVLVHYLNVPYSDDNKVISPALNYFADNKKEWTKDELISELKPMFFSENEPDLNNELEKSTVETIEAIVQQLMVKQRAKVKALEDASDGGINAKALTVVNAITNSAREAKQQQQNAKSTVSHMKNKQSVINKRDVSTCIITTQNNNTNDNSSKQLTTQGTVQLLQLSSSGQSGLRTGSNPNTNSSQSTPTSLIFNLSQFQSGSGLLILNSPTAHSANSRSNESQPMTGPLTLLYGRPHNHNNNNNTGNNNNGESTQMPTVVCSSTKLIRANLSSKLQQEMTINSTLDNTLNNINRLNTINLMNSENCSKIINKNNNNVNNENISNGLIDKNINNLSDTENSDENKIEDNKNSIDSPVNLQDSGQESICYNEESMIVNSNPSTPEHMKTSELNVNILGSHQTIQTGVDMNCNLLNHSQPQHLSLSHNHNYSFNHYYNNSNNTNNTNNNNQNNTNINHNNNSLLNYDMDPNDLNPMDFIDNDIPTPDETLFNLDTFDILGDIDNLDDLNLTNTNTNTTHFRNAISLSNLNQNKPIKSESSSTMTSAQEYRELAANIADYSPEWCYPEGGIKVLVAGPWFTSTYRYTILFDGVSVPTQLVQNGLLRCYSPEHEPGFVTLQVACDGLIISNSVIFEYRDHPTVPIQKTEDYFSIDENIFKFSLLERFELLESRLSQCTSKRSLTGMESTKQFSSFEDRLVFMCKEMANCSWLPFDESTLTSQSLRSGLSQTDMSLIHLTAALNYHKLIQCLLKWRAENPSQVLEIELDAFACDRHECTPLMWSCAKGHYESAILLYRWNRAAINLCNNNGDSPLHLARKKGFHRLVEEIERLENQQSISFNFDDCDLNYSINEFRKPRKASLDIPTKTKNICSSTVKRGSACLHHGFTTFPKLVKSFSADSSHPNLSLNSVNDQLNVGSIFLSSCISDSEDDLEMSTSSTAGLSSSHRDSIGSCDINMDCNSSEPSRVLTLAEHIIAAMPDRIKAASIASLPDEDFDDDYYDDNENCNEVESLIRNDLNDCEAHHNHQNHNQLNDNVCDFSYEISDNYNYRDANTPTNSSPASSSCLHSPGSFPMDSPSPPPTAADFCEFFQASGKIIKELGDLTLTDKEQRELYEAAKVIQKAYRSYKGRKRQEEQNKSCDKDKEKAAAILIQSYYRRYKQYIYYRQMTKAAQVIQNQYRSYCEHKRFKKSANKEIYTVVDGSGQQVNTFICNYSDCDQMQCKNSREGTPFSGLKRTYSQRRRNQAARKIQQFMRQSKNKLQSERALAAEKESPQEVHSLKAQTTQSVNNIISAET